MSLSEILAGGGEQVQHIIHDIRDGGPNWTEVGTVIIATLSVILAGVAVWAKWRKKK